MGHQRDRRHASRCPSTFCSNKSVIPAKNRGSKKAFKHQKPSRHPVPSVASFSCRTTQPHTRPTQRKAGRPLVREMGGRVMRVGGKRGREWGKSEGQMLCLWTCLVFEKHSRRQWTRDGASTSSRRVQSVCDRVWC